MFLTILRQATAQTTIPQPPTGGVAYSVNMKQPDEKGVSSPYGGGVTIIDFTVTLFNRKPGTPGYLSVDSMDVIFDYEQ